MAPISAALLCHFSTLSATSRPLSVRPHSYSLFQWAAEFFILEYRAELGIKCDKHFSSCEGDLKFFKNQAFFLLVDMY